MNDRPTPETDAEHAQFAMGGFTLDFCRKLERERDKAQEDATNYYAKIGELEKERDEALSDLEFRRELYKVLEEANNRLVAKNEEAVKLARTLKQERDEAREQLAAAKHFLEKYIAERDEARIAIISTLEENRHLADGDDCTLAKLKSVVPEWK